MKRKFFTLFLFLATVTLTAQSIREITPPTKYDFAKLQSEKIGRGVIAVRQNPSEVFVTWRYLMSDPISTAFNVYRDGRKINESPINDVTFFIDKNDKGGTYSVKSVINGKEIEDSSSSWTLAENAPIGYIDIPIDLPAPSYSPNDASVGDADGDGEYEIFLKLDPANAQDNAHSGITGNVYLDCYKLDGRRLWRINLGPNIRAGAHYTQFMVYDFDHDGKSEMICKTADGTIDGRGKVIGDATKIYRNPSGYILDGPEFLTIFNGQTGAAMDTIPYNPPRGTTLKQTWGDDYGNRVDRFLAGIGTLDGEHISAIMCRGYYTRTCIAAYDWDGKKLKERWFFDSDRDGRTYAGQGNHNLRIADVDGDGKDEIVYGSCCIDHDGKGLYTTGIGHGDAMHLSQFSLDLPGLQVWACHEGSQCSTFRDAATGKVIFRLQGNKDIGRCMAADIDPFNPGMEMWSSLGYVDINGTPVQTLFTPVGASSPAKPSLSTNMAVWWDGDLLRELLDGNTITKPNAETGITETIVRFDGCTSNNGTKSTPCIQGDIFGDWREEVLMRTNDNRHVRLYVSTIPTKYRFHTFLQDPVYRNSLAAENTAYNQPTQPGFYFGTDLQPKKGSQVLFRGTILK